MSNQNTNKEPVGYKIAAFAGTAARIAVKVVTPVAAAAAGTIIGMIAFNKYFKKD